MNKEGRCLISETPTFFFLLFFTSHATAHDTPKAVPTAARMADARFHKNFINLDLFSFVIIFQFFNLSIFQYFKSPEGLLSYS